MNYDELRKGVDQEREALDKFAQESLRLLGVLVEFAPEEFVMVVTQVAGDLINVARLGLTRSIAETPPDDMPADERETNAAFLRMSRELDAEEEN